MIKRQKTQQNVLARTLILASFLVVCLAFSVFFTFFRYGRIDAVTIENETPYANSTLEQTLAIFLDKNFLFIDKKDYEDTQYKNFPYIKNMRFFMQPNNTLSLHFSCEEVAYYSVNTDTVSLYNENLKFLETTDKTAYLTSTKTLPCLVAYVGDKTANETPSDDENDEIERMKKEAFSLLRTTKNAFPSLSLTHVYFFEGDKVVLTYDNLFELILNNKDKLSEKINLARQILEDVDFDSSEKRTLSITPLHENKASVSKDCTLFTIFD